MANLTQPKLGGLYSKNFAGAFLFSTRGVSYIEGGGVSVLYFYTGQC